MRVQLILEAVDRASRVIDGVHRAALALNNADTVSSVKAAQDRASQLQAQAQSNLVGAIATAGSVAAPIGKAVSQFNGYEDVLTDVGLKADLTGKKLVELGERARAQARALNTSSVDLLAGLDKLAEGGLALDKAEPVNFVNAKAAVATKAGIEDLSKTAVALVNNLKVMPEEYSKALDAMAVSGKEGQFELKDMAKYMPRLGAQYADMGQTGVRAVADLAAAMQVVQGVTTNSETTAAGLRDVLTKITGDKATKAFKAVGIDIETVMKEARAANRPIEAIVESLRKVTGGDGSKISEVFGDVQAQAAARALMNNFEKFIAIREKAMGASGTVEADFATRMGLGVEKTRALGVAFSELGVTMGSALAPMVAAKTEQLLSIVWAIQAWAQANPKLVSTIAMVATGVTGLMVGLAAFSFVMAALRVGLLALFGPLRFAAAGLSVLTSIAIIVGKVLFGLVSAALPALLSPLAMAARGFMALGVAMMSTPIGWIVAGVAAVAAGAFLIYRNWGQIGPWFSRLWATVGQSLRNGWQSVVAWFSGLSWPSMPSFTAVLGDVFGPIRSALASGWQAVSAWFSGLSWPGLPSFSIGGGGVLAPVLAALASGWQSVASWFSGLSWPTLPSFSAVLGDVFAPIVAALGGGWQTVTGWFSGLSWPSLPPIPNPLAAIQAVLEPVVTFLGDWGGRLLGAFEGAFGKVTAFIDGAASKIGSVVTGITSGLSKVGEFIFGPSTASVQATAEQAAAARAAVEAIGPAAQAAVASVTATFSGISFHSYGVSMMETLAAGIRAGAASAVAAARATVQQIRDHLPHSPAKVGPLSDLDRVQFSQTLAGAIRAGAPAALGAVSALTAGLVGALPGTAAGLGAVSAVTAGMNGALPATLPMPALTGALPPVPVASAVTDQEGPQTPAAASFARPAADQAGGGAGASGSGGGASGPITVSLTLSPTFSGSTGQDFIQQLRAALPSIGHELAQAIQAEIAKRDRTKH